MKSLAILVFLYLVTPGSGQLVWDGLPLSTRAEFATLVLLLVVFLSDQIRARAKEHLESRSWSSALRPLLVLLCVLKFLTFAWAPLSDGFGACYRSLYHPLDDLDACEKSYENPLIQNLGSPAAKISRMESVVDFGKAPYDWSLPFMNDFPRLRYLWLDRFPFAATYSARLEGVGNARYLPIWGIGKTSVSVNDQTISEISNYDHEYLSAVQIPEGSFNLRVQYEYRDDEASEPKEAPTARGHYARLKIGKPMSLDELLAVSRVRIAGVPIAIQEVAESGIYVMDRDGMVTEVVRPKNYPGDSESYTEAFKSLVEFPANLLDGAPLRLFARNEGRVSQLGVININDATGLEVTVEKVSNSVQVNSLSASLWTDRDSLGALKPGALMGAPLLLQILLVVVDVFSFLLACAIALALFGAIKLHLAAALSLGLLAWLAVEPLDSILPALMGGGRELVLPYALIALLVVALRRRILSYPLIYLTPLATALSTQKVFDHLFYNHSGQGDDWWGKLIFLWRDSDWFANSGNARAIFVEGSLRGGESVYWFRAAPRYLLFAAHLLLGENDVLIALVSVSLGFMVVLYLAARFADEKTGGTKHVAAMFVAFIGLIFVGDQLIVAFGFFISSEYPTWLTIFAVTAYLLRPGPDARVWVTTTMAFLIAFMVQFRPNGIFVSLALLPLLLVEKVQRQNPMTMIRQISFGVTAFLITLVVSLIHNLYYGAEFVLFTPNPTKMYAFDLGETFHSDGFRGLLATLWGQTASIMYWRWPNDPSYAIFFWGCQLLLLVAIWKQLKSHRGLRSSLPFIFLPLTYIVPMIPFTLSSYYPRLLVTASLLCLVSSLLIWPTQRESEEWSR